MKLKESVTDHAAATKRGKQGQTRKAGAGADLWIETRVVMSAYGDVAQMVERAVSIGEVKGSMPFFSTSPG